jgi:lipopolysaccharide export system protein LptA
MRITIKRLRWLIVGLACLLIAVVIGFLVYARYRIRHIGKDLPGKLGMNIQQTANGFVYSQSEKGHTLFTIRASKLVQFKGNGHAVLHDVAITLYGPPGTNREDHVYGNDFDYDQKNGIASAQGEVQIDLQSPQTSGSQNGDGEQAEQNTIHVKASGLVFNQKTGIATTDQPLEFQLPKAAGKAVGASFDSKQGVLVLDKQVELTTSTNGEPATVHAGHAQLVRDSRQAFLLHAETEFRSERSTADQAIVYFRKDGSAERIDAKGNVHTVLDNGATATSQSANILLDEKSRPSQATMGGGINFISRNDTESMHGNAVEGSFTFGPDATLKHAQFRNAVSFVDQQLKLENDPRGSATRQIETSKLDIDFTRGPDKKTVAQKALATGNAVATLRTIPSKGPEQSTTISADQLLATLGNGRAIQQLDGSGHTKIVDQAQDGATSTSIGDTLHIAFVQPGRTPVSAKQSTKSDAQASQIDTAIQEGNVSLTQAPAKSAKVQSLVHATAKRAEYHASDSVLHLTGNPRVNNGTVDLMAQTIDYHRDIGDAAARGDVKATYLSNAGQQNTSTGPMFGGKGPVHIIASEADLEHASGNSVFRGQARMWQGADVVSAPVIELLKTEQRLNAHAEADGKPHAVDTTIASPMGPKRKQSIIRVQSDSLVYSDKERRGDFGGNVIATAPDGTIHCNQAQFFLQPASQKTQAASQIDKIVAKGNVVLTQPGRKGQGEQLVYTSADGRYVLTGTSANPPRVADAAHGTTTGSALIFNDQDDSVEVSGGQSAAVTKTRVPK